MNAAQRINQTSGKVEYYTPPVIIEAARRTMGGFDLDPASSPAANVTVQARHIFTCADDGLAHAWRGRVWMNHPFGRETNPFWVRKLLDEYRSGRVEQACCITFAATSEAWFTPLFAFPLCFLIPRTNYLLPTGATLRGVTKGSVVTYLGLNTAAFAANFAPLGHVVAPLEVPA